MYWILLVLNATTSILHPPFSIKHTQVLLGTPRLCLMTKVHCWPNIIMMILLVILVQISFQSLGRVIHCENAHQQCSQKPVCHWHCPRYCQESPKMCAVTEQPEQMPDSPGLDMPFLLTNKTISIIDNAAKLSICCSSACFCP